MFDAAAAGRSNKRLNATAYSAAFMYVEWGGALSAALDTLRENKRVKHRVMKFRKPDAELNDTINARSNNSFNASGMSLLLIENLPHDAVASRRVNSSVRRLRLHTEVTLSQR
jgi:hypothetical protein